MRKVVTKLEMGVDVPLVIDTTELNVLEAALTTSPGRCLINSTHFEAGRTKADKVFALAKAHNAAVIIMTIDENGMAKTRERKLEIAKRIYDVAVNEFGLKPEDLVYDALTFTLATGDQEFVDSAIETIEGIRLIKQELPGVMASLGVSNLSFGFAPQARPALNSVMLYHCVQAGLDMAIVNPAHVTAYADIPSEEKELCEDLIFNRRADAQATFSWKRSRLEVARAAVRLGDLAAEIKGSLTGESLDFQTQGRLAQGPLPWQPSVKAAGPLIFQGHLRGSLANPHVSLSASSRRLSWPGGAAETARLQVETTGWPPQAGHVGLTAADLKTGVASFPRATLSCQGQDHRWQFAFQGGGPQALEAEARGTADLTSRPFSFQVDRLGFKLANLEPGTSPR